MPVQGDDRRAAGDPARLSPEMASFRALVLGFVRSYLAEWDQSPSYGEIANGLRSNRTRVKRAVISLEKAGLLLRRPGPRGLALPDEIERARQLLERAGMLTPLASSSEAVGQQGSPVTNPTLLPPPALDYPSGGNGSEGQRRDGVSGDSYSGSPQAAKR